MAPYAIKPPDWVSTQSLIQGVYDKVAHFECEYNLMALREKNFRHIIRKNKEKVFFHQKFWETIA